MSFFQPKGDAAVQVRDHLADFAERFAKSARAYGRDGADSFLGGYTEWLGGDFVDAMLWMTPQRWEEFNNLTEELLGLCHAYLRDEKPEILEDIEVFGGRVRSIEL